MSKTILITGSTDGIGLETAKKMLGQGHRLLLHGRDSEKLKNVATTLAALGPVESYDADLSVAPAVRALARHVSAQHQRLDVLVNNAGVLKTADPVVGNGLDRRFMVNTIAPYMLTKELLPLLHSQSRVINLSSAAQETVDLDALAGKKSGLSAMAAYAQSKLALTMWSFWLANALGKDGPVMVAVNPGSLLASKMVKEGFGVAGHDLSIGADILLQASLSKQFADRSGQYFDNDRGQFTDPHPDSLDREKCDAVVAVIEGLLPQL